MFAATLVHAAWSDYEEARELALDAADLEVLRIEAGAGSLEITGVSDTDRILVEAVVTVPNADADRAAEIMEEHMVLSLVRQGDRAELKSFFEGGGWLGDSPGIRLEVRVPTRMSLDIEDGSGSIEVRDVTGDLRLVDGSGSIAMREVGGSLELEDGSGTIDIEGAGGDVRLVDGSGSIRLRRVSGSASIEDGSGGIDVSTVAGDVTIPEAGAGSVELRDVQGQVVRNQ